MCAWAAQAAAQAAQAASYSEDYGQAAVTEDVPSSHGADELAQASADADEPSLSGEAAVPVPTGLRVQFDSGTIENVNRIVGFWPSVHWLNSRNRGTSMAALGYTWRNLKLEGALFRERESDQYRNTEWLRIHSASRRLAYKFGPHWALQFSRGFLRSPDQFRQDQKSRRKTASVTYRGGFNGNPWHATLAYGRGKGSSGSEGGAYLLDTALRLGQEHSLFGRIERAGHEELFRYEDGPNNQSYQTNKMSVGYLYEPKTRGPATLGVGALVSRRTFPAELLPYYGDKNTAYTVFLRLQMKFN
ncbi:hypothetical protein D3878_00235 [Noviherbaspirillum sedimenti]|uniref:Uncharacterized protein n=1 Tax=Noviherbaspirillum sedimenti TaxID=2320865 RepID=A0A3A3FVM7_9BURK|nr:hypothetical protein D3878_00235 [Noviherbaspirillum sedimenti]